MSQLLCTFPEITTVIDDPSSAPCSLLSSDSLRALVARLLPPDFSYELSDEILFTFLPCLRSIEWGEKLSLYLICGYQDNVVKFFYEMMSRWLLPGKRIRICSFFSTEFHFNVLPQSNLILCEMTVLVESFSNLESIKTQLQVLEPEIRLGLSSVYHAKRILEIKGLSVDEKTSLIQERITSILRKWPEDFAHDIFPQMHHFLIMCSDEFKAVRADSHMCQIICAFYLFRRKLFKLSGQRAIFIKLRRTTVRLPFGEQRVLGMCIGLNFQGEHELFDQRHLVKVLQSQFPELSIVEDSFFCDRSKEDRIQLLYVEVLKREGSHFSLPEVRSLKERLSSELLNGIERIAHPLFMPRNEEEVMRNIITLAQQLKYTKDLPQAILSFDEQTESELNFTIIWLRIFKTGDLSIEEIFSKSGCLLKFLPDRMRHVGFIRKKFPKEASVFRLKIPIASFLRSDHSVDLFKARHFVVSELQSVLGDFRDYNGGMIAKQHEQFIGLKKSLQPMSRKNEMLLENFFHSIYPIELRSLFPLEPLQKLFNMFLEEEDVITVRDAEYAFFLIPRCDPHVREQILALMLNQQVSSSQILTLNLSCFDTLFLGGIYREKSTGLKEKWLAAVRENLTFEVQTGYH